MQIKHNLTSFHRLLVLAAQKLLAPLLVHALFLGCTVFHCRVTPSIRFAGTHLYTWVERGAVKVRCLPRNTTQCPQPGLKPGLLVPELSPLAVRPPHSNSSFRQIIAKHDNKVEEAYRASLSRGIQRLSLVLI